MSNGSPASPAPPKQPAHSVAMVPQLSKQVVQSVHIQRVSVASIVDHRRYPPPPATAAVLASNLRIWTVSSSDGQPCRFREPLLSHAPPRPSVLSHHHRPLSQFRPMTSGSKASPRATANPAGVKTRLLSTRLHLPPSFSQSRVRVCHVPPSRRRSLQFRPLSNGSGPSLQARPNPGGCRLCLVRMRRHAPPLFGRSRTRVHHVSPSRRRHQTTPLPVFSPDLSLCLDPPEQPLLPSSSVFVSAIDGPSTFSVVQASFATVQASFVVV
ncbi:hypothetical protein VIGAN_04093100 [Vigna angularis var. angularis]|uniref:Uncharacterized protein n=1 Tax=Vigna angularis var. angularis TaxID=157739 RepID=A0A0S3RT13_PHAAN|nr:hypothetical protein VIGAN_04093100 [Vigna angularis var. angularis]